MDIVDQLKAFVATAQTGSFTTAAARLGISNRLTSKYVAGLEARLGVRLFQRTTRKVGLTPAGKDLLARAPALLHDLDELLAEATEASRGLSGAVRVSAPVTFGEAFVVGMLGRFTRTHPGITVDLQLSDRFVDLAAEGIDLAFRMGGLDMATLKVRPLGAFRNLVLASPGYIAEHGQPRTPADLSEHACIVDTNRRTPRRWMFRKGDEEVAVQVDGRFQVNSARASVELAAQGIGIAYAPGFALGRALAEGALVPLMEGYGSETVRLGAVYLEGRSLPRKVRALIDFAERDFRESGVFRAGAHDGGHGGGPAREPEPG